MSLEGRVAIVTGGGRGIGRAIVTALSAAGADIAIFQRSQDEGIRTASEISKTTGRRLQAFQVDVTHLEDVQTKVNSVIKEFGRVDILVNNAGVTRDNLIMRMSEDDWNTVIDTNLKGAWNCCKAVIRPMMKQRYGRIINVTSVSGIAGQAGQSNYSSAKSGMIGLTKALAREVASRSITVNAVAPGFIPTALTDVLPPEFKEASLQLIPMGRWGEPDEVAQVVLFFASENTAYITGQVLSVDGGMIMM